MVNVMIRHHSLAAGDGHRVHIALAGAPDGIPVVVFHGGPGSACSMAMLRPFDLTHFFVVMIDQRGCGRSAPSGRLLRNMTPWLIRDIERVRQYLGISRWYVFGGSWGATLAMVYAGMHPEAVKGLILRGVFLTSGPEIRGLFSASRQRAPRAWQDLYRASGADRPAALLAAIQARLKNDGPAAWRVAQAYRQLEIALLARSDRTMARRPRIENRRMLNQQRTKYLIQAHYLRQACGLGKDRLRSLALQAHNGGVSGVVVHGTRDPVCPPANVKWVCTYMPGMRRVLVCAGHLANEKAIYRALVDVLTEVRQTCAGKE